MNLKNRQKSKEHWSRVESQLNLVIVLFQQQHFFEKSPTDYHSMAVHGRPWTVQVRADNTKIIPVTS